MPATSRCCNLLHPLGGEVEGYSREKFIEDLISECEKDIRQCIGAGAVRVSAAERKKTVMPPGCGENANDTRSSREPSPVRV